MNGATLGEVAVDVYADTSRLEADLAKARVATERFDRQMESVSDNVKEAAAALDQADTAVMELARSYNPLHVAQARYIKDLEKINRLEKQGDFSKNVAADYRRRAAETFQKVAQAQEMAASGADQLTSSISRGSMAYLRSTGLGLAFGAAIGFIGRQMQQSVAAFMEHEQAVRTFGASLALIGNRSQATASDIREMAEATVKSSMQTEQAALKAAQTLATVPNLTKEALSEAIELSAKLADALGTEAATEAEKMASILTALADKDMKALVEATKGLDDATRAQMLTMAEAGKTADAQAIYMSKLASVVADGPNSTAQATNELKDAWNGLKVAFGEDISGPAAAGLNWLAGILRSLQGDIETTRWSWKQMFADASMAYMIGPLAERNARGSRPFGRVWADKKDTGTWKGGDAAGIGAVNAWVAAQQRATNKGFEKKYGGGGGGRGRSGGGGKTPENVFDREMISLERSILQERKETASTAAERADIELRLLELDREIFEENLERNLNNKRLTAQQANQLRTEYGNLQQMKAAEIEAKKQIAIQSEAIDAQRASAEGRIEMLQLEQELTRTQERRNEIETEISNITFKLQRDAVKKQMLAYGLTEAQQDQLEAELKLIDAIQEQTNEILRRKHMNPVERFYDEMDRSAQEIREIVLEWQAAKLRQRVNDAAQMADDISGAFDNVVRGLLSLESPIDVLRDLITDLASIFTEEVIIRPLHDWVRMNVAGPIAERVIDTPGVGAGPGGITIDQLKGVLNSQTGLGESALMASTSVGTLGHAATVAAQALLTMGAGNAAGGISAFFRPSAGLLGDVASTFAANPGIFHDGGMVGPGGRPIRRPGEVGITARVGEYVMPEGPSRQFRPLLDRMRTGSLRGLGGMGGNNSRNLSVSYGNIIVNGVGDERAARRTGKQIAAEMQRGIAKAARQGILRHD